MSQQVTLNARGLYTFPNNLSEVPPGSLVVADNVVIDRNSVIEPRRGLVEYGTTFGISTDVVKQLLVYKERILRHYGTTLQYDDGTGVFTSFNGSYTEPVSGLKIKAIESNGNFYFTTNNGIQKISATDPSQFTASANYIRPAGAPPALNVTGSVDYGTTGFFTPSSKVAYRVVWGYKDTNSNVILGAASSPIEITNYSTTQSGTVDLSFVIPSQITTANTDYFYQIYRTGVVASGNVSLSLISAGDEMNLVIEDFPSNTQLTNRVVTLTDATPESFRQNGALLYSNAISGEGIQQSNYQPPICRDLALFYNTVFYANTQTAQTLEVDILSVSRLVSGTSTITITDGTTSNTYTFHGLPQIANLTFDTKAATTNGGYYIIYSAGNKIKYVVYQSKSGAKEKTQFTFDTQANTADGSYFLLNSAGDATKYFVWFDKTGSTPTPANADTSGRTPLRVAINTLSSSSSIASAVANVIPAAYFTASTSSNVVTITNLSNGATTDATTGTIAPGGIFAISVTTQGANDTSAPGGADTTGASFVKVDISSLTTANDVANANATALINTGDFTSTSAAGGVITVTTTNNGVTTSPANSAIVPVGGAFAVSVTQAGDGENAAAKKVLLSGASSPAQAIDETARSLVNVINQNSSEIVNAYYLSTSTTLPGLINYQARSLSEGQFWFIANNSNTGSQFSPTLPTSGSSVVSSNEVEPNAIYYSKYQQPEAVPLVNKLNVGPKDKAILRILPLRNGLFILKEDAIYRLTGVDGNFQVDPFDSSAILIAPDSATVLNNQIYMFSSQGIVTITDTGVNVISRPIEDKLRLVTAPGSAYYYNSFGVPYESDRAYLFWTVTTLADTQPTQCFRYNTFTNAWTRFPISKTAGIVNPADDRLYVGAADQNFIEQERKNFNRTDYADREIDLTLGNGAISPGTIVLSSVQGVSIGDALVQTQYLTIFQFNQLLMMLDTDPALTLHTYFSTLGQTNGANLRDSVNNLAALLDTEPGLAAHGYVAAMGGGTSFANIQTDYNTIVSKLIADANTVFKNYKSSSGTIDFETVITGIASAHDTVTVLFDVPFIVGPLIDYEGIETTVTWAPQTFGDPSILKQVSSGTFLFENTDFFLAQAGYSSDLSPGADLIPFPKLGIGDWGDFVWDQQNWGGGGDASPMRTYIPRFKQRCRYLNCQFSHSSARAKFSLLGVSLTFRPISERAYRA